MFQWSGIGCFGWSSNDIGFGRVGNVDLGHGGSGVGCGVIVFRRIAAEVTHAHGLLGLACAHRIGRLALGEAAMVVATAAPHRKAALAAVEDFVAKLKRDVPIWKKEFFEDGAVWVGTPDDPQGERSLPGPTEGAR